MRSTALTNGHYTLHVDAADERTYTCVLPLPVSICCSCQDEDCNAPQSGSLAYRNDNILPKALVEHLQLVGSGTHDAPSGGLRDLIVTTRSRRCLI